MAQRISGVASIRVDGRVYTSNGEFSCEILDIQKTPVTTDNPKVLFYKEEVKPSKISGKLFLTDEMSPELITGVTNSIIQVQLKSGKVAILRDAFFSGAGEATAQDGMLDIEFSGLGSWL